MSKNAKPAAEKPAEIVAPAKGSKKKVIIMAVAAAAIAGGAAWFFTQGSSETPHAEEVQVKAEPQLPPKFIPLEPFTVNLQREIAEQYLQVGITLKLFDTELEEKIKTNLPEIRSKILLLLATKKASELSSAEGKLRLIQEIITISNTVLGIETKPAHAAAVAQPAAASQASAANTEAGPDNATPAPAAGHATKAEEKKGIVDVLFTSFIIQ